MSLSSSPASWVAAPIPSRFLHKISRRRCLFGTVPRLSPLFPAVPDGTLVFRTSLAPKKKKKLYLPVWLQRLRTEHYGSQRAQRLSCLRADALGRADVQRGPGGVRVAQSKPAAAPEEASEAAAAAEACGPARRRLRAPRDSETLAAAAAGPLLFGGGGRRRRRRRVRKRERASWVGEGRRSRHEARARGERPRAPRARVLGAAVGADAFSYLSPSPASAVPVAARPSAPSPLPHLATARAAAGTRPRAPDDFDRSARGTASRSSLLYLGPRRPSSRGRPFPSFEWRGGGGSRGARSPPALRIRRSLDPVDPGVGPPAPASGA